MFQSVFIAIYTAEVRTDCGDRLGRQEVEGDGAMREIY